MPLIDKLNDTKLKSLKWGNDRSNGGSSNEPYIKVDIRKLDSLGNQIRFGFNDDGLARGGTLGAAAASITDLVRIGKFLHDFPKGPLFIAKQIGLQLSNPRIEDSYINLGKISSTSKLGNLVNKGIDFLNKGGNFLSEKGIGPSRTYNGGLNTLAQIPINAFGGHIVRHGFLPVHDPKTDYEYVVSHKDKDDNRLVTLSRKLDLLDGSTPNPNTKTDPGGILSLILKSNPFSNNKFTENNSTIDNYIGGPDSVYGIGHTTIRRFDVTNNPDKIKASLLNSKDIISQIKYRDFSKIASLSKIYTQEISENFKPDQAVVYTQPLKVSDNETARKFKELQKILDKQHEKQSSSFSGKTIDHGEIIKITNPSLPKQTAWTTKFGKNNIESRLGLTGGTRDLINLTPLYYSDKPKVSIPGVHIRDLVKFRIEAIDTDAPDKSVWMIFRSYLKSFTDTPSPSWSDVKYIGRGEKFYTYNDFSRQVSLAFRVAALSEKEMETMYQKMNFLFSNTAPDYSTNNNFLRGPLMKLTVGNYLYRELGFISSLQYTISEDAPWEVAINEPEGVGKLLYELPMIMDISMTFTIIHNFLPQKSIGNSPFILNKPTEPKGSDRSGGTTADGANIDNPWLKQKVNGKYTNVPLTYKK